MRSFVVVSVTALSVLAAGTGAGSAATRSCGSVKPKSPPFNNPVRSFTVSILAGSITCAKADQVMADYYVGPGEEVTGPPNEIKTVFKNGYTCLQAGQGVTDAPITCTMHADTIHAVVVT